MIDLERQNDQWWRKSVGADVHETVISLVERIQGQQRGRLRQIGMWHELYVQHAGTETSGSSATSNVDDLLFKSRRARFNIAFNAVDTVHSRITKHKPEPKLITTGANWKLRRKAIKTSKYLHGEIRRMKIHEDIAPRCALNAMIDGHGLIKISPVDGRPHAEVVMCHNVFVDEREARHREVRTMYQLHVMDKDVLQRMFPEHKAKIEDSKRVTEREEQAQQTYNDLRVVVEAWHLRSGPDEDDGRHVIVCDGCTLSHDEWKRDTFPFVEFPWSNDPNSHWGIGVVSRCAGSQEEANRLSDAISDAYRLTTSWLLVEKNSKVNVRKIVNQPLSVIEYEGIKPELYTPQAVSPDMLAREQRVADRSLEEQGISKLSARAEKPAGLDSGKALMTYQDSEAERMVSPAQRYEHLFVRIAEEILACTDELLEDGDDEQLEVHVGKQILESIKYKEVSLKDAPYEIEVYPVSHLPQTPAGRQQAVANLIQMGLLTDAYEIRKLLAMPDLERQTNIEHAGMELVEKMVERALDGKPAMPNPYMPLLKAHRHAVLQLNLAMADGASIDDLSELQAFIGHVETLAQQNGIVLPAPYGQGQPQMQQGQQLPGPAPVPMAGGG